MRAKPMFGRRRVRELARHGADVSRATEVSWEIDPAGRRIVATAGRQPERYWKVEATFGPDGQRLDNLEADLRKSKTTMVKSMTTQEFDALIQEKVDEAFSRLTPVERNLLVKSAERRRAEASLTPSQRLDGHVVRDTGGRAEGLLISGRDGVPTRAGMAAPNVKRASLRNIVDQPASLPDGTVDRR